MDTLAEDLAEMDTQTERAWVVRQRHDYGIRPHEEAVWFVQIEQSWLDPARSETHVEHFEVSPADALAYATSLASNARRRNGTGSWTLETFGDGVNGPRLLRVRPCRGGE